jgi:hypothetical protein
MRDRTAIVLQQGCSAFLLESGCCYVPMVYRVAQQKAEVGGAQLKLQDQ